MSKRFLYYPHLSCQPLLIVLTYLLLSGLSPAQSISPSTPAQEYIRLNGAVIAIESNVQGAAAGPTPIPRAGFSYARTLTIAPSLLTTDLDSFPVLFAPGALSDLASSAHGGKVQSESGYDIVFTGDAGGTVLLNWEVENYDPATGTLVCWIQVPRLSRTSPTYIFMSYGNASATSLQSNATAVWDSNYAGVYHFSTGTGSTLSVNDSTANHNSGTSINGPVTLTSKLGGAVTFNNSNISLPTGNLPSGTSPTTLEGWFNIASLPPDMPQDSYLVSYGQPLHGEANGIFFEAVSGGGFKTGWDSHAALVQDKTICTQTRCCSSTNGITWPRRTYARVRVILQAARWMST